MDILNIKELYEADKIEITKHMFQRMQKRGISISEIREVINSGEIIEEYPEDYPYPSCLILGHTKRERVIHIVMGTGDDRLWLITAYCPETEKWDSDFRVRREK